MMSPFSRQHWVIGITYRIVPLPGRPFGRRRRRRRRNLQLALDRYRRSMRTYRILTDAAHKMIKS